MEHQRERRVRAEELARGEVHTVIAAAVVDEGDVGGGRVAEADVVRWVGDLDFVRVWVCLDVCACTQQNE